MGSKDTSPVICEYPPFFGYEPPIFSRWDRFSPPSSPELSVRFNTGFVFVFALIGLGGEMDHWKHMDLSQ